MANDPELESLARGEHGAPFNVLGVFADGNAWRYRVLQPHAETVELLDGDRALPLAPAAVDGVFEASLAERPAVCRLRVTDRDGASWEVVDPYSFPPQAGELDVYLWAEGTHLRAYEKLGAHRREVDGVGGVQFSVWAPNAVRVSVVGAFNRWDGRHHPMQSHGGSGLWELFIPGLQQGDLYKFEIKGRDGFLAEKADPFAFASELRPLSASMVWDLGGYEWGDDEWMAARRGREFEREPMSIYEVHLGSWRRRGGDTFLTYAELADELIPYAQWLGFTHIELLPVTEHPLDASWGYQTIGYFAPTSRFGSPDDFRAFVDRCHQAGLGVIIDWVPAHFPKDPHGLAFFDGTHLFEHADPRQGEHRDWGTLIFNYGRNEVRSFLLSNAMFWADQYHVDGFRVDAVASMLYLDYSREAGEWIPNQHGGNENLEAVSFLRKFNEVVHGEHPGILTFAEESTSWPMVSRPTFQGGLGFGLKWNMGWMNDSLSYFQREPVHRKYHHNNLTFSLLYAFTENFILPFSHDEVVHGKGSLLNKMPGDDWQKFAGLRLLYTWMFTHPGKKLLFMGCEFAQWDEWDHDRSLDWHLADSDRHRQVQLLVRDLNELYRNTPALRAFDFSWEGFEWIDCTDADHSVLSFVRKDPATGDMTVVLMNCTPVERAGYRVGLPADGRWRTVFNSDSEFYGGGNKGLAGSVKAEAVPWQGRSHSLMLDLPALAGVVLRPTD